jgi:RNA polymerase sigma factor (sigma-70 family)
MTITREPKPRQSQVATAEGVATRRPRRAGLRTGLRTVQCGTPARGGKGMETDQACPVDEQVQTMLAAGAYRPALTLMAETYWATVFRYCLRMCKSQTALAEEVTQQVFEAACRGIEQFRAAASAKTWLLAIAHHQVLHLLEQQQRRRVLQHTQTAAITVHGHVAPAPAPESVVQTHHDVAQLRVALAKAALAPVDRSIVWLRFGMNGREALSVADIATLLGLSRDMVYRRLTHTLDRLRRSMEHELAS